MHLPPPWLQCLPLWRHLFDEMDVVSSGMRDKAQPGHGSWVVSMGIEVCGACLLMELLFRYPGFHLWLLSDQPLDLCHCRLLTLKPQGFQLLCSGHCWRSYVSYPRLALKLRTSLCS